MLLPTAEIKTDPHFGKTEIYHDTLDVSIPYDPTHPPKEISLTYQGCSQKGLCYAPITKAFKFDNIQNKNLNAVSSNSEVDTMQFLLQSQHIGLILLGFFIAGLLLSLTPCVLPMIPILSSIIFASHKRPSHQTRLKDFFLSLSYVGGVSFTYTLIGIFAGLSGNLITSSIQSPLLMIILGIVLSFAAIGILCWLLFTLAVFALPFFAGVTAGTWAYDTGAGWLGAILIGMLGAGLTLGVGQLLLGIVRPLWARLLIALAFVAPAAIAGFHATHGIVKHTMPSETWQLVFSVIGAVAVGVTAFARVAGMASTGPSSQGIAPA